MRAASPPTLLAAARLLLRCRRRIAWRRFKERAFELLILGPMVIGALWWVTARYLDILRPALAELVAAPASPTSPAALGLALILVPVLWPGSLRELFGHAPLDGLPVPEGARLALTLAAGAGRAAAPSVVWLAALWVLAARPPAPIEIAAVVGGCVLLSWLTLALAALLVHLGKARALWLLGAAGAAAALAVSPASGVLLPWGVAGAKLYGAAQSALAVASPACVSEDPLFQSTLALSAIVLGWVHLAWRRGDLESYLQQRRAGAPRLLAARLLEVLPLPRAPQLRALVRRDLRLVTRRFSPAVHVGAGLAAGALVAALVLGLDRDLTMPDAWRRAAMVAAATLAVLATVSIVPFLLRAQLSAFWLEKVTGAPLRHVWQAKVLLSMLLAAPVTAGGVLAILTLAPGDPAQRGLAVAQLVAAAFVVSSFVGVACFEIATEPLIGVVWSGLLALALAAIFLFYPKAFWLALLGYLWAGSKIAGRASRRVRLTEVAR